MTRSFAFVLLLIVCLALLAGPLAAQEAPTPEPVGLRPDAPQYALHGPYWVGTRSFSARTDTHATTVQLWYPALNPEGEAEEHTYTSIVTLEGNALANAEPDKAHAPYPLVVLAHGSSAFRFASAYLAEHLASQGLVVMAIEYQDAAGSASGIEPSMLSRPQDVTWQIDLAEELTTTGDETIGGMIDTERIAVVGHSFGAYTALMAGGAQLDFDGPTSACQLYPDLSFEPLDPRTLSVQCDDIVRELVELLGLEAAPKSVWPSWGDPRVDAIVPMAPDMTNFGEASVSGITIPAMLMVGTGDSFVYPDLPHFQPYLYDSLSSSTKALIRFTSADHMIFTGTCESVPWMVPDGFFWCSDPVWDMDRAHDLINHFTTAFLLDTLKGDEAAHAALSPDAVAFPGIEYQAEGF